MRIVFPRLSFAPFPPGGQLRQSIEGTSDREDEFAEDSGMNKHNILMLIGCVLPLLLIFLLPLFGFGGNLTLLLFIVLMLICHLMMPMHGGGHDGHGENYPGKEG